MDPEERKLQIRLAQINNRIQIGIAWVFGSLGGSLALLAYSYEVYNQYLALSYLAVGISIMAISVGFMWVRRVNGYWNELDKFQ